MGRYAPKAGILISIGILIVVAELLPASRSYLNFQAVKVLSAPIVLVRSFLGGESDAKALATLRLENEKLKAELFQFSHEARSVTLENRAYIIGKIYSTYPFNNRSLVTINVGSDQGLRPLLPVMIEKSLLFGQITEVSQHQSIVRTVFDPDWKVPVKIGEGEVDALLVGGRVPKLTLIVNGGGVKNGDTVYVASHEFPFGVKIGEVTELRETSDQAVKEAEIKLPFTVSEVKEVFVLESL